MKDPNIAQPDFVPEPVPQPPTNEPAEAGVLDQFQTELVDCWRRLPNKALFFALLAAWLGVFVYAGNPTLGYVKTRSLISWVWSFASVRDWAGNFTDNNLSLWMPLVVLGLLWWKRKQLLGLQLRAWWPGLLLVGCALGLHIVAYMIQEPLVSILAMAVGVYALMGLVWGPEWLRTSFFPCFLLVLCVPLGAVIEPITFPLRLAATHIVELIAHWILGIDVIREGTILKDPAGQYQYEVAAACSGIHSLVAVGLVAVIMAFVSLQSWWRRGVLIASAVPFAVVGNVVRLLCIVVSAALWGQEAGNYVHHGGPGGIISLLPYVPAFLGLWWLARVLEEHRDSRQTPS